MIYQNQFATGREMDVFLLPTQFSLLFPLRKGNVKDLNYESEIQLYKALTCSICNQLMQAPVYLKCSHRFCRPCIQRRIRNSTKKSCPTCHTPLLSKRDLRADDFTIDFVDIAFNSSPDIIETDDEGQEQQAGEESEAKVEADSQAQIRRRYRKRPQSLQSSAVANPPTKRQRLNKAKVQVNISNQKSSYLSNSSKENEENNDLSDKAIGEEVKSENYNQIKVEDGSGTNEKLKYSQQQEYKAQKRSQQLPVQRQKNELFSLKKKYGQSFFKENISKVPRNLYIRIKLLSHPNKLATPLLDFSEIDCPIDAPARIIFSLLAKNFNLANELIELFVQLSGEFRQINPMQTLAMLNQQYWMGNNQVTFFDFGNIINKMSLTEQFTVQPSKQNTAVRLMYFCIDFERYRPNDPPSKMTHCS